MASIQHLTPIRHTAEVVDDEQHERGLLRRVARRDQTALAEFYERYRVRLFGYLFRVIGEQQAAEDTLQEVLLVVWQKADSYRGSGKVSSWLFGIAHHLAMGALRRSKSRQVVDWEAVEDLPHDEPDPEADVIQRASGEAILKALASLTPDHRAVLELAFYQEFSCKEIAQIAGVPEGTVKSRLSYARRALKAALLYKHEEES